MLCDYKWLTPTTAQLGFKDIPRAEYAEWLSKFGADTVKPGRWETSADARTVAAWRPAAAKV